MSALRWRLAAQMGVFGVSCTSVFHPSRRSRNCRNLTIDNPKTRECDRCGETITAYCPSLTTFSHLKSNKSSRVDPDDPDAVFAVISTLEQVSRSEFDEYAFHRMYERCEEKVGICPHCAGRLRTWRAKQCPHCLANWRE